MITINLLPEHLRPVKRTPLPYFFGVAFLAAALVGIGFVYLQNQRDIASVVSQLEQNRQDLDDLKDIVEQSNALVAEKNELAVKLKTIQEIVLDRITWSRQLHNINRLAPPNLWFEGISVENKPFKERVPYTDTRTGQTKEKVVRVDRPVLKLAGYVISVDGETPTISPLTLATEQDEEFSQRFELLTTAFADTTFENFPVRSFTLEYSIEFPKTMASDTEGEAEMVVEEAEDSGPSAGDAMEPGADAEAPAPPDDTVTNESAPAPPDDTVTNESAPAPVGEGSTP